MGASGKKVQMTNTVVSKRNKITLSTVELEFNELKFGFMMNLNGIKN